MKSFLHFGNCLQPCCCAHTRIQRWALAVFAQHLPDQPARVAAVAKRMGLCVPPLLLRGCLLHVHHHTRHHTRVPVVVLTEYVVWVLVTNLVANTPCAHLAQRRCRSRPPVLQRAFATEALGRRREKGAQAPLPPSRLCHCSCARHKVGARPNQGVVTVQQSLHTAARERVVDSSMRTEMASWHPATQGAHRC